MKPATGRLAEAWAWRRELVRFLVPPACVGCGCYLPAVEAAQLLCPRCRSRVRPLPGPSCPRCGFPTGTGAGPEPCLECADWDSALLWTRSACILEDPVSRLVHALKYGGWRSAAPWMGLQMEPLVQAFRRGLPRGSSAPVLVPIPTTAKRERRRGYNQAAELARALAARSGLRCHEALIREGEGATQVALQRGERGANVQSAFRLGDPRDVRILQGPIILIDDVLTTGATLSAATGAISAVARGPIGAVTFSRALPLRRRTKRSR